MVDILNSAQPTNNTITGSPPMPPEPPPVPPEIVTVDQPPKQEEKSTTLPPNTSFRKKKSIKGAILAMVLLLLITLPLAVFYVSQQKSQNDIRSRADEVYPNCPSGKSYQCCIHDSTACGGNPEQCHCQGGDACTGTVCESSTELSCKNGGRSWCTNWQGSGMTCCVEGYKCCSGKPGCCNAEATPIPTLPETHNTPIPTQAITSTPIPTQVITNTPTPTSAPQCPSIQVYIGDQLITDYSTIMPGDTIIIVVGSAASQIRVNGGTFVDLTDKNTDGFWVYDVVIPPSSTSVTIEVQ
jgi:hypothetical protein